MTPDPSSLEDRVERLLADPEHADSPLREPLDTLWTAYRDLDRRLERIAHISDAFQSMAKQRELGLVERMDRDLRRLEKLARISDHYQAMMRDLNQALEEASTHDSLTGLPNRRLLTERLNAEVERDNRYRRPFSVAMLDIDRFKSINDHYGHDVGDQVLVEIATALRAELRDNDIAGRWGGEEFLLLLPETRLPAAQQVLERVRAQVRSVVVPGSEPLRRVTASAGLAEHEPGMSVSATITRADIALRAAKRNGRDRCELALPDAPPPEPA